MLRNTQKQIIKHMKKRSGLTSCKPADTIGTNSIRATPGLPPFRDRCAKIRVPLLSLSAGR